MRHWYLLLASLLVYLLFAFYQLSLPGLHYDEAFEVVPAMQILKNLPITPFRESAISLFGRRFPLTTQDYIGALNTYGALPFLALGGVNTTSLRVYSVLIGLLTLLLVYGLSANLARQPAAGLIAVAWLAVNPTFIFWSRQGVFVTAITAAIGVAAAWSWLYWWRSKSYRFALLGAFLFGLGLYAKLLFGWLIGALLGAFVLVVAAGWWRGSDRPRRLSALFQRLLPLSGWQVIGLPAAGIAGCWPLVVYNLQTGGTFKSITENAGVSYYGVNNADVLTNLATRTEQLGILLNGGHLWYLGNIYTNPLTMTLLGLAFMASLWLAYKTGRLTVLIPYLVIILVVGQSVITVSALWVTHYALIMVWPAIAFGVTWMFMTQAFQNQPLARPILTGLVVLLIMTEAGNVIRYHQALKISGGLSTHSDAIYDLAVWLEAQNEASVIGMDWGLAAPITFLTAGRVTPIESFGYAWAGNDRFAGIITPHLSPQGAIFLWRAPDEIIFDRSADFKALYRPLNLEETILAAFYERSGRPVMGATQLVPAGTAENKPLEP
jgi:4-amino-4-deoxy-L-arabinose transferase-like glycosyltransferase